MGFIRRQHIFIRITVDISAEWTSQPAQLDRCYGTTLHGCRSGPLRLRSCHSSLSVPAPLRPDPLSPLAIP